MSVTELKTLLEVGAGSDLLNDEVLAVFPEPLTARWLRALRKLEQAGYGNTVVRRYIRHSVPIARHVAYSGEPEHRFRRNVNTSLANALRS